MCKLLSSHRPDIERLHRHLVDSGVAARYWPRYPSLPIIEQGIISGYGLRQSGNVKGAGKRTADGITAQVQIQELDPSGREDAANVSLNVQWVQQRKVVKPRSDVIWQVSRRALQASKLSKNW